MEKGTKRGKKKKEVDIMITAAKLQEPDLMLIKDMESFIEKLKKQQQNSQEDAYKDAKQALYRTGVISKNGKTKKKIVTWE